MLYLSTPAHPWVQEPPSPYSPFSRRTLVYEVALRTASPESLKDLSHAHRLVRALVQGEVLGAYELMDFLLWPEGVFLRVRLEKTPSLAEFLGFLREKSTPPEMDERAYWKDEPLWIRPVPPEKLQESARSFLETAESLRKGGPGALPPTLFFFYRNPRLNR